MNQTQLICAFLPLLVLIGPTVLSAGMAFLLLGMLGHAHQEAELREVLLDRLRKR